MGFWTRQGLGVEVGELEREEDDHGACDGALIGHEDSVLRVQTIV